MRRNVPQLSSVICVVKQKMTAMSHAQNRPVGVGDASKGSVFTARRTSSPCRLVAPDLWCHRSEHGVVHVGDGKWVFHRTLTSQVATSFVSGHQYKVSRCLIRGQQLAFMSFYSPQGICVLSQWVT